MLEAASAKGSGDKVQYAIFQRKVDLLTAQLNESNPILTEISGAMTREGIAREKIAESYSEGNRQGAESWKLVMEKEALSKKQANDKLMQCNLKYQNLMKELHGKVSQEK